MKPAEFTYHRPRELDEALALLAEHSDEAKVLAGGQSLLPIMNMRLAEPAHLIDVTAIRSLREYRETADSVVLGATTRHFMIEDGLVPDPTDGLLPTAAHGIAHRAIRTRGTLGGSVAHSDSSAEWPTIMSAVDATVHLASARGRRTVPVREFLEGFFMTVIEPDELIVAVEVPRFAEGRRSALHKIARRTGDFAESLAVATTSASSSGAGTELWLGAARDKPVPLPHTENAAAGASVLDLVVDDLVDAVGRDIGIDPDTDDAEARFALQLHAVSVHRSLCALEETMLRV